MDRNTIFRLKGYELHTGNIIYTEWKTLDMSLIAVSEFYKWFSQITYNQSVEYKQLFKKGGVD